MAVTKEFLLAQMKKIETNYGKDKFVITQKMFDLWYEMFSECSEKLLLQAVNRCLKENEFAPNIAGLMKYYREIEDNHNELVATVKSKYQTIRSVWGEQDDLETIKAIYSYLKQFPEKDRKSEMIELCHRAVSFRNDCSADGRTDIPTILEYVKGSR